MQKRHHDVFTDNFEKVVNIDQWPVLLISNMSLQFGAITQSNDSPASIYLLKVNVEIPERCMKPA